jgi:Fe2+ transport system protein B
MSHLGTLVWEITRALVGFGCNVTGVFTCCIIVNAKDRIVGVVTIPLILSTGRIGAGPALIILSFGPRALPVALIYLVVNVGVKWTLTSLPVSLLIFGVITVLVYQAGGYWDSHKIMA